MPQHTAPPAREERWRTIRRLWRQHTVREIAEITGRTEGAVRMDVAAMRKAGISLPPRQDPAKLAARDQRIVELWEQGASVLGIASELRMTKPAVTSAIGRMRRRGIHLDRRLEYQEPRPSPVADRIVQLWQDGHSCQEIADRLEVGTASDVASRIAVMRREGRDLPRRR